MNTLLRIRNYLAIALSLLLGMAYAQYPELNSAQNLGSASVDQGIAITTDGAGNVYTTGFFVGTVDFDPGTGVTNLISSGSFDIFVTKFDAAGNLVWAKNMGGNSTDVGKAIAVDGIGNVYLTGHFSTIADFDPGAGVSNLISAGNWDAFVCKLDSDGDFVWAGSMGGISLDTGNGIALDAFNAVVVAGQFSNSGDFDPGAGTTTFTTAGLDDIFMVKLNGVTGSLIWAKQIGGVGGDQALAVTVDASDNVLATGVFFGSVDFDPGIGTFSLTGTGNDAYVLKLDTNSDFIWAAGMGGNNDDVGRAIKTDAIGNVYTTGYFVYGDGSPHDFDPGPGVFHLTPVPDTYLSNSDIYISKLSATGSFIWAKHVGGIGTEQPSALALDGSGNIYTTGHFQGTVDFDPGSSNYSFTATGLANIYTSKLNASGDFVWADKPIGTYSGFGRGIVVDNTNQVVLTGQFANTVDFSAGACDFNLTSNGQSDIFIQKLSQTGPPPPYIASFTPIIGLSGTVITLTGTNFDPTPGNNIVKFNGTTAVVTASTATSITTSVPVGATTGFVTVSVGCAMGTSQVPYTVDSCVPVDEKNALQQLYNSTDGVNWTNNTNWLTTDVSTWYGVTVTGCSVTEIRLDDNGLTGELPYDLVNLNALEVFDVNENNLSGYVPESFLFMPNLNSLNLSNNNLAVLPNLTTGSLNTAVLDLDVSSNALDFGDLESNMAFTNFNYVPQANIPPSQLVGFSLGGTLTINFSTPGTANSYQWFKEGASISGATNTILTIPSATVSQVGNYTVQITNTLVPGLTLQSDVHQTVASPCGPVTRTSGQLDVTFNHAIDNQTDVGGVAVQSTGKVIVALPTTSIAGTPVIGTVRFNTDGTLDGTFNTIPEYMIPLVQADDKILGYANDQVIRYNADGTEDVTFNGNAPQSYSSSLYAIALQPDGKIVYSVESYMGSQELLRLNTDGNVDPSFTIQPILATVIKVQADGKILIARNGIVSRLNSDGTDDLIFSVGLENVNSVNDIAIQPDGKILIAGNFTGVDGSPHFGIARINADGSADNTFTALGVAELALFDGPYKIGLMSNGQIILAGHFESVNGAPRKNLVRLTTNGGIDCGFDSGISTDQPISGLVLQSDDKILITGYFTDYDGTARFGLARVNNGVGQITIDAQPTDFTTCAGQTATFTTMASGTTNITYQWQFSSTLTGSFINISDGGGYTNTQTASLSINTTGNFGAGFYRCSVNGDLAATVFTNSSQLTINPTPLAPSVTNASRCGTGSIIITASGGTSGEYRWYTVASGGTAIAGEVNGTYTIPNLTTTTNYFVSINDGTCESARTSVVATFVDLPLPPVAMGSSVCMGSPATLTASGGVNGQYKWYTVASGGTAIAGEVNSTYTTPNLTTTTTYFVSINDGTCESSRTSVIATIITLPTPPLAASTSICSGIAATLTASGGVNGQYKWYTVPTGGTAIAGEVSDSYTTPLLTTTTTYYITLTISGCESLRTSATASIINPTVPTTTGASVCPGDVVALTAAGGVDGQYKWYSVATGGTPILGEVNSTYQIPSLTITSTFYVSITVSGCESPRASVAATILTTGCAPVITPQPLATQVEGKIVIDLVPLITTVSTLDVNSIKIVTPPSSGAEATITSGVLTIDYAGRLFSGTESIGIEACNINGTCGQQDFSIEVTGDIVVYNAVSPNGDGKNDFLFLQYIEVLSSTVSNQVAVYNRWGDEVFSISDYDNKTRVFAGLANNGNKLPTGTYFYKIILPDAGKTVMGFISVKH